MLRNSSVLTARVTPPFFNASEAATPAASPTLQQVGMMRTEACASCVVEMHLPATNKFSAPLGIRQRYGMP